MRNRLAIDRHIAEGLGKKEIELLKKEKKKVQEVEAKGKENDEAYSKYFIS